MRFRANNCFPHSNAYRIHLSIDMGTGYDCSDVKAHMASSAITSGERRWRDELVAVMARQGFVNYSKEWWHFSLPGAGGAAYDFPIEPRRP